MRNKEEILSYLGSSPDLNKFNNCEEACLYYYGLLKQLDLRIINTEIEVENIDITSQRSRKELPTKLSTSSKFKQQIQKTNSAQLQIHSNPNQFECKIKGCLKQFDKKSALQIHDILRHKTSAQQWTNNRIFQIDIREISQGRRGPRPHQ